MTKNSVSLPKEEPRRVHATVFAQDRAEEIFDLAALRIEVRQGDSFDEIPVYAGISCGEPKLPLEKDRLNLNTWQVLMRVQLENARITLGSIRKFVIQEGSFESSDQDRSELSTIDQQRRLLGYGGEIEAGWSFAKVSGLLKFGRNKDLHRTHRSTSKSVSKGSHEIRLFGDFGDDTIGFGDKDYGDVRRKFGFLAAEYPFEKPEEGGPLFRLQPINPVEPVRMTIFTVVPFDRLHIDIAPRAQQKRDIAEDQLKNRGLAAVERLRRRLLADETQARARHNQRDFLPRKREGEFVVAIERIEIHPKPVKEEDR